MPTTVLLDGTPVHAPDATMHGAIRAARAAAGSRLIVEVRADGVLIDPDAPDEKTMGVARIEMLTADPVSLARAALHESADRLEEIATVQADAAGFLQTGDTERAMGLLMRSRETWAGVVQTIELIMQTDLLGLGAQATLGGVPLHQAHVRLNECLRAVIEALTAQDHAALADVLAYDLRDLAREWTRDLRHLAEGAEQRAGLVG